MTEVWAIRTIKSGRPNRGKGVIVGKLLEEGENSENLSSRPQPTQGAHAMNYLLQRWRAGVALSDRVDQAQEASGVHDAGGASKHHDGHYFHR